ncbi:hypothetical protein BSKO_07078 [Bryopsis sp. KO-2023]|nr:hypothetical protein BSKO_07078 [Bryopsis sp. KO-2023]
MPSKTVVAREKIEMQNPAPSLEGPPVPVVDVVEDSAYSGPQPQRSHPRGPKKRANAPRGLERRSTSLLGEPSRMKSCGGPSAPVGVVEDSAWGEPEASLVSDGRQPSDSARASSARGSPREVTSGIKTSTAKDSPANRKERRKRNTNPFNKFCREHKELGLSPVGLGQLYKKSVAGSYAPNLPELNEWRSVGAKFTCGDEAFMGEPKNFSANFFKKSQASQAKSSAKAGKKPQMKKESQAKSNSDPQKEEGKTQAKSSSETEKKGTMKAHAKSKSETEEKGDTKGVAKSSSEVEKKKGIKKSQAKSSSTEGKKVEVKVESSGAAEKNVGVIKSEAPVEGPPSSPNEKVEPEGQGENSDQENANHSNRKPNRWNVFQAMFSGWDGPKIKEAYRTISKGFAGEVLNAVLGIDRNGELDGEKKKEAAKALQGYKEKHESDMEEIAERKNRKGCSLPEDSDRSLSPQEIRVRDLSRTFQKPIMDLRKQNREKMPHSHDRLFKGFSAWMLVCPTKIRCELPTEEGVYEWGFKIPKGKEITCFYLGKAMNLRARLMKYIDPKQNQVIGPREDQDGIKQKYFQELSARGCSFYVRCWKTTDAKEVEGWLLEQVNYGLNKVKNGEKRAVEMEGGRHFPDLG